MTIISSFISIVFLQPVHLLYGWQYNYKYITATYWPGVNALVLLSVSRFSFLSWNVINYFIVMYLLMYSSTGSYIIQQGSPKTQHCSSVDWAGFDNWVTVGYNVSLLLTDLGHGLVQPGFSPATPLAVMQRGVIPVSESSPWQQNQYFI